MRSRAWQAPFTEVPWADIAAWFHEGAAREPALRYGADIVDSVRSCGGERHLAGLTSMYDLVVTSRPVPRQSPIAVVVVRSPSTGGTGAGDVLVEHRSTTGHDDRVIVPAAQAVPLFWRFVAEKFGVRPDRSR